MIENRNMKGIILAGGKGSRLNPITKSISKQLLPIYDKPMIYYPLSTLMLAGIKDILIISTPRDLKLFEDLLGNGSNFGINLYYRSQSEPNGLAEAFIVGEDFIGNDDVTLILGDNIFYGHGLTSVLKKSVKNNIGVTLFGHYVNNPEQFGIVEFDIDKKIISIEEKPSSPKSNYALTGLYVYDNNVVEIAKKIKPSSRGELEISSINNYYLEHFTTKLELLGRGYAWLDTGTFESLIEASNFVMTLEKRQGLKIACLEEIALNQEYISLENYKNTIKNYPINDYRKYLERILDGREL